jgi:uncharacterized cupin superfamily protein
MNTETAILFANRDVQMNECPIHAEWIIEGSPICRNLVLSSSTDGTASTLLWDCTAGRFNWFYDVDETLYIIEGSVIVKNSAGVSRRVSAGDTVFFPAGSRAEWTVETYVRKIAFCRTPLSAPVLFAKRVHRFLRRVLGLDTAHGMKPAMFLAPRV